MTADLDHCYHSNLSSWRSKGHGLPARKLMIDITSYVDMYHDNRTIRQSGRSTEDVMSYICHTISQSYFDAQSLIQITNFFRFTQFCLPPRIWCKRQVITIYIFQRKLISINCRLDQIGVPEGSITCVAFACAYIFCETMRPRARRRKRWGNGPTWNTSKFYRLYTVKQYLIVRLSPKLSILPLHIANI